MRLGEPRGMRVDSGLRLPWAATSKVPTVAEVRATLHFGIKVTTMGTAKVQVVSNHGA